MLVRPKYSSIELESALSNDWRGYHLSRKMDGVWSVQSFNGCTITGETMKDGSFHAFDIVSVEGDDCRRCCWKDRRDALLALSHHFPAGWQVAPEGNGAEFIQAVLRDGAEGIVAKQWDSYFGYGWIKAKIQETHDCTITEIDPSRESIRLTQDGIDRGWCPVTGGKLVDGWLYRPRVAALRVGDVVEVACHSVTAKGKFREARFVRQRPDKLMHPNALAAS